MIRDVLPNISLVVGQSFTCKPRTPWNRTILNKFGKRPLAKDIEAMLYTTFQASESGGSEEGFFFIFFYVVL